MRRSSTFMLAYIIVICIGVFVRAFLDYPMWNALVLAVTVSSIFFAIESMLSTAIQSLSGSCEIIDFYVSQEKRSINNHIDSYMVMKELSNFYTGKSNRLSDLEAERAAVEVRWKQTRSCINEMERTVQKYRKNVVIYQKFSHVFALIGYLCLFGILFFYQYFPVSLLVQEMITVASFAIVLTTQQISQYADEQLLQEMRETRNELISSAQRYKEITQIAKKLCLETESEA